LLFGYPLYFLVANTIDSPFGDGRNPQGRLG